MFTRPTYPAPHLADPIALTLHVLFGIYVIISTNRDPLIRSFRRRIVIPQKATTTTITQLIPTVKPRSSAIVRYQESGGFCPQQQAGVQIRFTPESNHHDQHSNYAASYDARRTCIERKHMHKKAKANTYKPP